MHVLAKCVIVAKSGSLAKTFPSAQTLILNPNFWKIPNSTPFTVG